MKLLITLQGETTEADLSDGTYSVGSAEGSGIQIASLPLEVMELRVDGDRLTVLAHEPVAVDGVLCPAGVPRLILAGEKIAPGEGIELAQVVQKPSEPAGTVAMLKHLLGEVDVPEEARCASVTCLTGLDAGRCYPVWGSTAEIGRGENVQIRIRDRAVSRKHARIRRSNEGYVIDDLGSPNGVFVDGQRAQTGAALKDGSIIELGHSLLRFRGPTEEAVEEPADEEADPSAAGEGGAAMEEGAAEVAPESSSPEPRGVGSDDSSPGVESAPSRGRWMSMELALISVGVALAFIGVLVTFGVVSGQ